jgi:hypothetical protein
MTVFVIRGSVGAASAALLIISACSAEKAGSESASTIQNDGSTTNTQTSVEPTTDGTSPATSGASSGISGTGTSGSHTTGGNEILPCESWNDECPDGMKCIPYLDGPGMSAWTAQGCFPIVKDPGALGEACVYPAPFEGVLDTCDKGLVCFSNICMPLCGGEPTKFICPDTFACATVNNPNLVVCLPTCDPRKPCESADDVCRRSYNIFQCGRSNGSSPPFVSCVYHNECASGFCAPSSSAVECQGSDTCCAALCNTDAPQCPGAGQTCQPLSYLPDGVAEYQNLGSCTL